MLVYASDQSGQTRHIVQLVREVGHVHVRRATLVWAGPRISVPGGPGRCCGCGCCEAFVRAKRVRLRYRRSSISAATGRTDVHQTNPWAPDERIRLFAPTSVRPRYSSSSHPPGVRLRYRRSSISAATRRTDVHRTNLWAPDERIFCETAADLQLLHRRVPQQQPLDALTAEVHVGLGLVASASSGDDLAQAELGVQNVLADD